MPWVKDVLLCNKHVDLSVDDFFSRILENSGGLAIGLVSDGDGGVRIFNKGRIIAVFQADRNTHIRMESDSQNASIKFYFPFQNFGIFFSSYFFHSNSKIILFLVCLTFMYMNYIY